jgi:syntaxin-binding protein 5
MRGPRVILEVGKAQQTSQRHSLIHRNSPNIDPVLSLKWAVSGVKSGKSPFHLILEIFAQAPTSADATPRIRLVAARTSGHIQIYTLVRDNSGIWSIPSAPSEFEGVPTPLKSGTFVLDAHTGAPCKADKAHLTAVLESKASSHASEETIRCLLLIVGAKGTRCLADLGDERVARVEWGQKAGNVVRAQVVERNGSGIPAFDPPCIPSDNIHSRISRASRVH